jgi:Ubiquitin carboxyl-terminal hydrolase, family 1
MKNVTRRSDDVWFIMDKNACGTLALLQVLLNTPESLRSVAIHPDS